MENLENKLANTRKAAVFDQACLNEIYCLLSQIYIYIYFMSIFYCIQVTLSCHGNYPLPHCWHCTETICTVNCLFFTFTVFPFLIFFPVLWGWGLRGVLGVKCSIPSFLMVMVIVMVIVIVIVIVIVVVVEWHFDHNFFSNSSTLSQV